MKKLLLLALFSSSAFSAPFVTTDPLSPGATSCGVFLDASPKIVIAVSPATAPLVGNICKFDVGNVSVGSHTIKMTAIPVPDPIWGTQESAQSSPLSFIRPAAISVPSGLQLVP
jgi:hypothetical protein